MNATRYPNFELRLEILPLCCYILAHVVIFVPTVLGNFAVVLTTISKRFQQSHFAIFLRSLAVADLLTGIIALPAVLFARVVISPLTCLARSRTLFFTPAFLFFAVSVGHLVALTIDRLIEMSTPLKYIRVMTIQRCRIILLVSWFAGAFVGVTDALVSLRHPYQWVCGTVTYEASVMTIHSIFLAGFIPVVMSILLLINLYMVIVARRQMKEFSVQRQLEAEMDTADVQQPDPRARVKETVTAVLVVLMFAACWMPLTVKAFLEENQGPSVKFRFYYQTVTEYLAFSNSFVNPIIYSLRNDRYKTTYKNVIRRCCLCFRRKTLTNQEPTTYMRYPSRPLCIPPTALIRSSD